MIQVAAYCRVSTDQEDQANSFLSQKRYFQEYIDRNPEWELIEIYADEGFSGTSTRKRAGFNRMIEDAFRRKFQLIVTKEVSRFSRNIVDTILYTRELKLHGVSVLFLTENIDTSDPKSEMLLSFMATLAQEESRKTGCRVTWGQQRQMEKGVVFGHSMLGYDIVHGSMHVNPEGAEIVRLIFQKYTIEAMSAGRIAKFLQEEGYRTFTGNPNWNESHILKILKNEKYMGDLVQRKSFTPDYLTHQRKANHGEVPLITIENHHTPIIDRTLWEQTQKRLWENNKHNGERTGHSNRYLFSGKIKCGICGASFVSRRKTQKNGTSIRYWCCATAAKAGKEGCGIGIHIRDTDATQMLKDAFLCLNINKNALIERVAAFALEGIQSCQIRIREQPESLQQEIQKIQQKKERTIDAYFAEEIGKEDMLALKQRYELEITQLQKQLKNTREQAGPYQYAQNITAFLTRLLRGEIQSDAFYGIILENITIFPDRHMELTLRHLPQKFIFRNQLESH